MNFTHSSWKSWALIRRLGVAQQPPKSTHPSVSANAVATHFIQVAKAPHDKKFECQVRMQGRSLLQQMSDKSLPHPFTEKEILTVLQKMKPATAPGYDNIHVEFLKNLGPKARTWLSKFFVCRAELFCSRCQTRVFLIHSAIAYKNPSTGLTCRIIKEKKCMNK